jgi:hypothetical protein
MQRGGIIDDQFTDRFNEANALWDEDRLEECIVKARELLAEPAIPRYHEIKTLLLLASTVEDWYEANGYRIEAEGLWRIVRRWHPEGEDEELDGYMAEIRGVLDEADRVLQEEEPYNSDSEADSEDEVQHARLNHDEEVADAQALMQDMDIDGDKNIVLEATTTEAAETITTKTNTTEHHEQVSRAEQEGTSPPQPVYREDGRQMRPSSAASSRFARHDV